MWKRSGCFWRDVKTLLSVFHMGVIPGVAPWEDGQPFSANYALWLTWSFVWFQLETCTSYTGKIYHKLQAYNPHSNRNNAPSKRTSFVIKLRLQPAAALSNDSYAERDNTFGRFLALTGLVIGCYVLIEEPFGSFLCQNWARYIKYTMQASCAVVEIIFF